MTGVATTTGSYKVRPSPLLREDLKILPLSAEDDITRGIEGLPKSVLALKGEGRSQAVEEPLDLLFFRVHHEEGEPSQLIKLVNEGSSRHSPLAKIDERLGELISLRMRDKFGVEVEKEILPPEDAKIQAFSYSPPPMQGGTVKILRGEVPLLDRRKGHAGECLIAPLNPG